MKRKFRRQQLKKFIGSNRIRNEWRFSQIRRYGFIKWFRMRVACDPGHRRANTLAE